MSQNRKLQGEIDRILKKVQEGCAEFDSILSKVYSATSTNQKEKYEADLKKEIKKLQRVRDQIKTWISSNEVRQKNPLLEARRTIETKMEQFKACERDSKTKAYSKEGLALDEEDDAKKEARSWIGKSLKDLQTQIDMFEAEIETVPAKKRTGNARVDHLNEWITRHKFHINKLEKVLRALENDAVMADQITEIQDSINHYIEHNQDSDFFEEEDVYDSLGLKESDYEDSLRSSGEFSNENSDIDEDDDMMSQTSTSSTGSVSSKKSTEPPSIPASASAPIRASGSSIPTPATHTTGPFSILSAVKQAANPLSRSDGITKSTVLPAAPQPPKTQPAQPAQPPAAQPRKAPAPAPTPAAQPGPPLSQPQPQRIMKPPSAWPGIGQSQPSVPPAVTAPPAQAATSAPSTPQPPPGLSQPQPQQPLQQLQSGQKSPDEPFNRANPTVHFNQFVRNAPQQHPGIQFASQPQPTSQSPSPQPTPTQPPTMGLPGAHLDERATRSPSLPPQPPIQAHSQGQANFQRFPGQPQLLDDSARSDVDLDDRKNDETFGNINVSASDPGTLADLAATTQHKLNVPQPQQAQAFPVSGEQDLSAMAMLDCSLKNIPEQYDSERIKPYVARNPHPTPSYYPQNPAPIFENPALFENFDTDTLFFIFYYQQGTYQQYLAAKELKKQSWRYHKKYLTWFQRHEEPKEITNDYEQGTYVYFDYETGWCQRKKTEFTFEYRYLEDYD